MNGPVNGPVSGGGAPGERPAVTIVVPVWNAADVTATCLRLLQRTLGPDDQVVVVDNGSEDHTPVVLAEHASWVTTVIHEENLGFAAGCNAGAAVAQRPVIIFLNNDTLPVAGWLEDLLHPFARSAVGAVGPMSNFVSGPQMLHDPGYAPSTIAGVEARAAAVRAQFGRSTLTVDRLVGFCLAVRRDTFEGLGGFDTSFGIGGCEDDDLSTRIRRAGLQLLVVRGAFLHHIGHQTFDANAVDWAAVEIGNHEVLRQKEATRPSVSVLLWCGDSFDALLATVVDVVDSALPDDAELLLLTADEALVAPVVAEMGGSVTVVAVDDEPGAWRTGLLRATGARRALVRAGERVDAARLGRLLATSAAAARPGFVGVGDVPAPRVGGASAARPAAPLVTVIVRTFNRPRMLTRCLDHLARQRSTDFEVVVVNDAGQDVAALVAAFPALAVVVVTSAVPAGRAGALNAGLRAARGQLVCIVDDDDVVYPEHLSSLVAASSGARRAVHSIALEAREDDLGEVLTRRVVHDRDVDRRALLASNSLPILTVLFPRREAVAVGGFDEDLPVLEDWEFWMRLSAVLPFERLPQVTCEYRLRGDRSNSTVGHRGVWVDALRAVDAAHPSDDPEVREVRRANIAAWDGARPAFDRTLLAVGDVAAAQDAVRRSRERGPVTQVVAVLVRDDAGERFAREHAGPDVDVVLVHPERFEPDAAQRLAASRALGAVTVPVG